VLVAACAALLAGCDGSLQSELSPAIGQPPAGSSVAAVVSAEAASKPESITTASAPVGTNTASTASSKSAGPGGTPGADTPVKMAALSGPDAQQADRKSQPAAIRLPPAAAELTAMAEPGHVAYRIGPLDVLTVTVFRVPELSAEVQVADNGTISLPLIGDVAAVGRTAKDVEKDVAARLGEKYLQNPQVTVFIKEYNAQRVTVNGAVKKPGVFPLKGKTTLLQLISMAEGLDHNRASSNVVVFREVDGKRAAARFDLDEISSGKASDPVLQAGDVVVVDDSSGKIIWQNILRALPITHVFTAVL